jgi:predicted nucleotidyltransferase
MSKNIGRPFDTSVLDAALAQRQAKNEQERQAVLTRVLRLLDEIGPAYGIQQAYVFGSLTKRHRFRLNSDVDIAVEQINPERFFEAMSKLSTYLGREVDLVELNKCHFADKIRREGVMWTPPV